MIEAVRNNNIDLARQIKNSSVSLKKVTIDHLLTAITGDNHDYITLLVLVEDVDINKADNKGITPLIQAINIHNNIDNDDNIDTIKLLINLGADINQQDENGNTPLIHITQNVLKEVPANIEDYLNSYRDEGANDSDINFLSTQINKRQTQHHTQMVFYFYAYFCWF
jgi:ankyrin repeat protein